MVIIRTCDSILLRCFVQAVVESDITLLVGHHYGISQLIDNKNKMASIFADFSAVKLVEVAPQQPGRSRTKVKVDFQDMAVS